MKKVIFILTAVVSLAACSNNSTETTSCDTCTTDTCITDSMSALDSAGIKQIIVLDSLSREGKI